jgi:hypothetical protein
MTDAQVLTRASELIDSGEVSMFGSALSMAGAIHSQIGLLYSARQYWFSHDPTKFYPQPIGEIVLATLFMAAMAEAGDL